MLRDSAGTWSPCRPMRGSFWNGLSELRARGEEGYRRRSCRRDSGTSFGDAVAGFVSPTKAGARCAGSGGESSADAQSEEVSTSRKEREKCGTQRGVE